MSYDPEDILMKKTLSDEEIEELKRIFNNTHCHICGSSDIYKNDGTGPLCFKCARRYQSWPPRKIIPTPGRNTSCPCGSGKKYKKCCLNK
jgi:hypothetical protein